MSQVIDYDCWIKEIAKTNNQFKELLVGGKAFPPIFFFGNPENAVAATIGVNPSYLEFALNRNWNKVKSTSTLIDRCKRYFESPLGIPPYPWFEGWEAVLSKIGLSYYKSPKAVHLDLSPRATQLMRTFQSKTEIDSFLALCQTDMKYLVKHLLTYPKIRHLFLAGAVTKRYYANQVLRKFGDNISLTPILPFPTAGPARLALYKMKLEDEIERYLLFFSICPSSASGRNLLIQRIPQIKKNYPEFVSKY